MEITDYGYRIKLDGNVTEDEAVRFLSDVQFRLKSSKPNFGVIFDFRDINPLSEIAQHIITTAFVFLKGRGMLRSAVLYSTHAQIHRLAESAAASGLDSKQRYFSSLAFSNPEREAIKWIKKGKEIFDIMKS